jgi:hypothetical protein
MWGMKRSGLHRYAHSRPADETPQAERAKLSKSHGRYDWRGTFGTAGWPPIAQRPPSPTLFRRAPRCMLTLKR